MINEVMSYRDYMNRYFYSMEEDAVPSTTTANVTSAPVILNNSMKKHKKKFIEYLGDNYESNKNNSI